MNPDQLILFPELESTCSVKDIDYVDISTLEDSEWRKNSFSLLPKNTYIFYKTGYHNPFKKDNRPIYPYLKSFKTDSRGKVLTMHGGSKYQSSYPVYSLKYNKKTFKLYVHVLVGLCFLENDNPALKTLVDHINNKDIFNYHPTNLRWATPSENSKKKYEVG